jgi:hypothetical protein
MPFPQFASERNGTVRRRSPDRPPPACLGAAHPDHRDPLLGPVRKQTDHSPRLSTAGTGAERSYNAIFST